MTDTKPDAEKALREAHEAAKIFATWLSGADPLEIADDAKYWSKRDAITIAINRAVRAAWEAGFANGMQTSAHALDNTPPPDDPDWLPKEES